MNGAGGYTGGCGENKVIRNDNGLGGSSGYDCFGGGGYFSKGTSGGYGDYNYAMIGGQGGTRGIIEAGRELEAGGDGGIAGKGGTIKVSQNSNVYAYNGNKYTDGTAYNDGFNQLEIYSQNGILRDVYKYNSFWGERKYKNYEYLYSIMGNTLSISSDIPTASESNPLDNILIRSQTTVSKSGYINLITNSIYGIGSGAGYIELSNGTYTIDSSLN